MARSRNTADTQTASGGPVSPGIAGKNAVINGGFDVWQRGTSFTTTTPQSYMADRWMGYSNTTGRTYSRQSSGLTGIQYGFRLQRDSGNTNTSYLSLFYSAETADSLRFAGQTVTLSFYAKAGANFSASSSQIQYYLTSGTGTDQNVLSGYTGSVNQISGNATLTTTYQRFSASVTLPTTVTELGLQFFFTPVGTAGTNDWCEITGVQLELGTVATPFSRAGGTIQGELAACQRYYYRAGDGTQTYPIVAPSGITSNSTSCGGYVTMPVRMRALPTAADYSNLFIQDTAFNTFVVSSISIDTATFGGNTLGINFFSTGMTGGRFVRILGNNSTSAYLALSAEL